MSSQQQMLGKLQISQYLLQYGSPPKIEDVIPIVISDPTKQRIALDFAAWLRANKMTPSWRGLKNSWAWRVVYKGKTIVGICLSENGWDDCHMTSASWFVIPYNDRNHDVRAFSEMIIRENYQGIIQDNQLQCVHKYKDGKQNMGCSPDKLCAGGMTKNVFDKDVDGLCYGMGTDHLNTRFYDPGESEIECIKKLIECEQQTRNNK